MLLERWPLAFGRAPQLEDFTAADFAATMGTGGGSCNFGVSLVALGGSLLESFACGAIGGMSNVSGFNEIK